MSHAFEIFENQHWALLRVRPQLILIVRRTGVPYESAEEVKSSFAELEEALSEYNRKHFGLLVDLRSAPQRNDPEYEEMVRPTVPRVHAGFLRNAIMVRMAVGALQIKRHAKGDVIERLITSSEAEALDYLKAVLPAPQQIMKK